MYAGSPRIVSTLWSVREDATAELMKSFYWGILHDHLAPAAALRRAQLEIAGTKNWSEPFYWAAFTIQGEWH